MMTWISFVIGFVASPIGTRLFATAEWGKINMFGTISSLIGSICYLGLDQAFVRFFSEPTKRFTHRGLLTFCTAVPLAFSVISSLVLVFFWQTLSGVVVGTPDFSVFLCLCIYSFCLVLFRFLSLCYRMEQNAKLYTIQGVIHVLLTKVAYLAVGFGPATGKAALICLTVLMAIFTLVFLLVQRSHFDMHFLSQVDKKSVHGLSAYALPLLPIAVLSWLNNSVSAVILRQLMDFSALGIYSSALGLASTVNIIQTGFNTYWAPYVFENYQCDEKRRFYTVHRLMACLLTFFGLGLTLLQAPVFLLLGTNYRSSVIFFPFLFLSPICYCLGETTGMGITISKKSYWTTIVFVFSSALNISLCYLLIPLLGMIGAAQASAGAAILTLILRTALGEKYYKAIDSYRFLFYTVGLMLLVAFGNLLLTGLSKYLLILGVIALACVLFANELRTLFITALQVLHVGRSILKRDKSPATPKEDEHEQ